MSTKKKGLSRDEILERLRKKTQKPFEVDGEVLFYVKEMSLADKRRVFPKRDDGTEKPQEEWTQYESEQLGIDLLSHCVVDEDGGLVFEGGEGVEDLEALGQSVLVELIQACTKLNLPNPDEIRKNSEAPPATGLSSSSPSASDAPVVN